MPRQRSARRARLAVNQPDEQGEWREGLRERRRAGQGAWSVSRRVTPGHDRGGHQADAGEWSSRPGRQGEQRDERQANDGERRHGLRQGGHGLGQRRSREAVVGIAERRPVEQGGQHPHRHGLPADERGAAAASQRDEAAAEREGRDPAEHDIGFRELAVPRLGAEQPQVKPAQKGAEADEGPAEHVSYSTNCMSARTKSGPVQDGDSPLGSNCDVLVVGGGPAAATAARLLATWGRDVLVVARPDGDEPELPVSLTPSCRKFFDLMGIAPVIEAAGFVPSHGHTVWWGGAARVEPFAEGQHGWQATTAGLSRVMLTAAAAAGARIERASVTVADVQAWPARFRVDATGRAGVLARPLGQRRYEPGHRTVALIGVWQRDTWEVPDPSHTLLESYADGWGWSVPVAAHARALAVMVDPQTTQLTRGAGARGVYLAEVAKTTHLSSIFDGATLVDGPAGWDASLYVAERMTGDDWLLAGDANSFVDPLSSAGVKKAMASGWLAAVAVNTALGDPALTSTALDFFAARERATYDQFLALTRGFLLDGAPAPDHPFWADRGAPPPADDRAAVLAAHERLRAAASLTLRVAPDVTFAARPALTERQLVLEERLVTPLVPDGVRHVDGVDVVALVRLAAERDDVSDLFTEYGRRTGAIDPPALLKALATAVARGWLIGV